MELTILSFQFSKDLLISMSNRHPKTIRPGNSGVFELRLVPSILGLDEVYCLLYTNLGVIQYKVCFWPHFHNRLPWLGLRIYIRLLLSRTFTSLGEVSIIDPSSCSIPTGLRRFAYIVLFLPPVTSSPISLLLAILVGVSSDANM